MNHIFRVMWVEDTDEWYTPQSDGLGDYLFSTYGLILNCERKFGDDIDYDDLQKQCDLIIVDYDLGGITGDGVIKSIRTVDLVTDILYYSSQYGEMKASVKDGDLLDGAYFADREKFEEVSHRVIDKLVRRSEDLVNLRGFVLDSCSDFETRIKNVLIYLSGSDLSKENKLILIEKVRRIIQNNADRENKLIQKNQNQEDLALILEDINSVESMLSLLNEVVSMCQYIKDSDRNFCQTYRGELNTYRIGLAHRNTDSMQIKVNINGKYEFVEVNKEFHRKMRMTIVKHDKILTNIESELKNLY
jgi:hypothetical protein